MSVGALEWIKEPLFFFSYNTKLFWRKCKRLHEIYVSLTATPQVRFLNGLFTAFKFGVFLLIPILTIALLHVLIEAAFLLLCNLVKLTANYIASIMFNFFKYSVMMLLLVWILRLVLPEHGPIGNFFKTLVRRLKGIARGQLQLTLEKESNFTPIISSSSDCDDSALCVVCLSEPKCVMLLPCRHLCLCSLCSQQIVQEMNTCPLCRATINQNVQAFM